MIVISSSFDENQSGKTGLKSFFYPNEFGVWVYRRVSAPSSFSRSSLFQRVSLPAGNPFGVRGGTVNSSRINTFVSQTSFGAESSPYMPIHSNPLALLQAYKLWGNIRREIFTRRGRFYATSRSVNIPKISEAIRFNKTIGAALSGPATAPRGISSNYNQVNLIAVTSREKE